MKWGDVDEGEPRSERARPRRPRGGGRQAPSGRRGGVGAVARRLPVPPRPAAGGAGRPQVAPGGGERDAYVFGTKSGKKDSPSNVRTRLVAPALKDANTALEKAGEDAGPEHLTPHGLRHTFASCLLTIGEHPRYVMGQLGHADPTFTLRVYAKEMDRETASRSG